MYGVNLRASRFLYEKSPGEKRYELAAVLESGDLKYLSCSEWRENNHFDFFFQDLAPEMMKIVNIGHENMDTVNPVRCVKHDINPDGSFGMTAITPDKGSGEKNVVFIGDSFTYGKSVPAGLAYPDAINNYLRLLGNPQGWRAFNFGVVGADISVARDFLFKKAMESEPDIIVYAWVPDDTPYEGIKHNSMERFNLITADNPEIKAEGPAVLKLMKMILTGRRLTKQAVAAYLELNSPENEKGVAELGKAIQEMKEEAEKAGVEFKVALFPLLIGNSNKYPLEKSHRHIRDVVSKAGVECFDLTEDILDEQAKELWTTPADRHPNVRAHRKAAKAMMKHLSIATRLPIEGYYGDGLDKEPVPYSTTETCQKAVEMDPALSGESASVLRDEIYTYPRATRIATNSSSVYSALKTLPSQDSDRPIMLAHDGWRSSNSCDDKNPCLYLLFISNAVKSMIDMASFNAPYFSRITLSEGMVLFLHPADVDLFPKMVVKRMEDLCPNAEKEKP
ncbi:MAG TPA: SGNH/GDSL hydrolase family protein [bacterium]|nr:SGNH/GDSL hydrolase family protein [bacterium]